MKRTYKKQGSVVYDADEIENINAGRDMDRTSMLIAKNMERMQKNIDKLDKRLVIKEKILAEREANGTLPPAKSVKVEKPKSLKRKKQLDELQMLKKEVENSKITDIKLDSSIEGMIIKLDAHTKSNVLRKQVKYLLEEFEKDMITNIIDILFKIDILINKLY
jgi:hypothetical protein